MSIQELIHCCNVNLLNESYHPLNEALTHYNVPLFKEFNFEKKYNIIQQGNKIFIKLLFKDISIFDKILSDVTRGTWCPNCFNKTEEKLYNEIIKYYNINRQIRAEWCKNINTNKYLPFDFLIEDLKIIIEQDGPQHFKQVGNWQSPKITQINDLYKTFY